MENAWKHPPQIIQWDISSRCNLFCKHCRVAFKRNSRELEYAGAVNILKQITDFAPDAILAIAGGEPLTQIWLKKFLFFCKKLDRHVEILTNGTLISKSNISWLTETASGFNVSLESASAEINDNIRGLGAFKKALKGIELLLEKNAKMAVRMTFFNQDEDEPEKLLRLLKKIGVDFFNFRYVVPVGNALGRKIGALQYKRLCEKIWNTGKKLKIQIGFSDPFPEILLSKKEQEKIKGDEGLMAGRAITGCSIGFTLLYLTPSGTMQLCPYLPILVDDAKKKNLKEIWFKNEFLVGLRNYRSLLQGKCGNCEYKFACGGCRGAANALGNILGEDPRCWK